jgi:hypothetical protein
VNACTCAAAAAAVALRVEHAPGRYVKPWTSRTCVRAAGVIVVTSDFPTRASPGLIGFRDEGLRKYV